MIRACNCVEYAPAIVHSDTVVFRRSWRCKDDALPGYPGFRRHIRFQAHTRITLVARLTVFQVNSMPLATIFILPCRPRWNVPVCFLATICCCTYSHCITHYTYRCISYRRYCSSGDGLPLGAPKVLELKYGSRRKPMTRSCGIVFRLQLQFFFMFNLHPTATVWPSTDAGLCVLHPK